MLKHVIKVAKKKNIFIPLFDPYNKIKLIWDFAMMMIYFILLIYTPLGNNIFYAFYN